MLKTFVAHHCSGGRIAQSLGGQFSFENAVPYLYNIYSIGKHSLHAQMLWFPRDTNHQETFTNLSIFMFSFLDLCYSNLCISQLG